MNKLISICLIICICANFKSESADTAKTFKLNNGKTIPAIGYGTWKLNFDRAWGIIAWILNNNDRAANTIAQAIKTGYRHIDSAYFYDIEQAIGIALRYVFSAGIVKREDLFITTKVWCNHHSPERVIKSLKISLNEMGIEFVDLALIHFPTGFRDGTNIWPIYWWNLTTIPRSWEKHSYLETWRGMEEAQRMGLTKSIGVSNFNVDQLQRVIESAKIKPVTNQVECNPYYNQKRMLEFCKKNNVILTAYSPLNQVKDLLSDPTLQSIAMNHRKSVAQVALRWNVQRGVVIVPKSENWKRMAENLNIFDFELTQTEMNQIDAIEQRPKNTKLWFMSSHPDYPYNDEYL